MGTAPLNDAGIATGKTVEASHVIETRNAIRTDIVPRNTSGTVVANQYSVGTSIYPYRSGYFGNLIVGGRVIDPDLITTKGTRIISAQERTTSEQPDFLRADGAATEATIEALVVPLVYTIDGVVVTLEADILLSGLTVAPSTNNTALVDDATLIGQTSSKYQGERETVLTLGTVGAEIVALVGQWIALEGPTSGEVMVGYLRSSTEFVTAYRGYCFDSTGTEIRREVLSDGDTLTLLSLGYVFLEDDAVTTEVTYLTPIYSATEPAAPVVTQYWQDLTTGLWNRYNGTTWDVVSRIPLGVVVIDATNCIASRSYDPYKGFESLNTASLKWVSNSTAETVEPRGEIAVYGGEIDFDLGPIVWDMATDIESGFIEAASTDYYLYLSSTGERIISPEKSFDRPDLQGEYHPFNAWRFLGQVTNDVSSNLINTDIFASGKVITEPDFGSGLPAFIGVIAYASTLQVLAAAPSLQKLQIDTATKDPGGGFNAGLNRFVVGTAGVYSVRSTVLTLTNAAASLILYKNGTALIEFTTGSIGIDGVDAVGMFELVVGDYIETFVQVTAGGPVSTDVTSVYNNRLEIGFLGT